VTVTEAILQRRSIRKYKKDAEVTDGQVKTLLTAAMAAPSACNSRPWEFTVVRDRDKLKQIMKIHPFTKMLSSASLAIVVCARPDLQDSVSEGFFPQDCGAATENILLQAVELGLGTCWCGVYPKEPLIKALKEALGIGSTPFNVIAVGAPDETPEARGFYDEGRVNII
jgi:nitroreductase